MTPAERADDVLSAFYRAYNVPAEIQKPLFASFAQAIWYAEKETRGRCVEELRKVLPELKGTDEYLKLDIIRKAISGE